MYFKKTIFVVFFLVIFGFLFNLNTPAAKAMTSAEIQALIQQLQAQIVALQKQLTETQGTEAVWCHNFSVNLKIGDTGSEVGNLVTALKKEGFEIDDLGQTDLVNTTLDESIASAISGLQQKYAGEILKPLGLQYGTGYLGKSTRTKLNKLYGCDIKPSPIATPTPACNVFLTCETGYTPYNVGEKDNQGCPIIKCITVPTPVPIPSVPIPIISEQVKCLFYESKSKQECYSSNGNSCSGIEGCVVDIKGPKSERITWKSSCGGYAYTTIDGNNEYAEFKCVVSTIPIPTISIPKPPPRSPFPPSPSPPLIYHRQLLKSAARLI